MSKMEVAVTLVDRNVIIRDSELDLNICTLEDTPLLSTE